jgi:hypothetical protein
MCLQWCPRVAYHQVVLMVAWVLTDPRLGCSTGCLRCVSHAELDPVDVYAHPLLMCCDGYHAPALYRVPLQGWC